MNIKQKQDNLEILKKYKSLEKLEYGMYIESHYSNDYHGYFIETDGNYIKIAKFDKKGKMQTTLLHPKDNLIIFDNPVDRNIVYDFSDR